MCSLDRLTTAAPIPAIRAIPVLPAVLPVHQAVLLHQEAVAMLQQEGSKFLINQ